MRRKTAHERGIPKSLDDGARIKGATSHERAELDRSGVEGVITRPDGSIEDTAQLALQGTNGVVAISARAAGARSPHTISDAQGAADRLLLPLLASHEAT